MPEAPRLTVPGVSPAPLPGARVTRTQPSLGPDLSGPLQALGNVVQDEIQKADQVRVNDADNQASTLRDRVLYGSPEDPSSGLLNKKGHDAFSARQQSIQDWEDGLKQIGAGLNDRQRLAFQQRVRGYSYNLHEEIQAHVAAEAQRYDADTTNGYIANRVQDAARNFASEPAVEKNLSLALAALKDHATRNGKPEEWTQSESAKLTSGVRLDVLKQLLVAPEDKGGGDLRAAAYLNTHRLEMTPQDLAEADRITEAGSVRGESQRQGDIIAKSAGSLSDALNQAGQIQDPRVREATEHRVRQYFADQAASDRDARNAAFDRASRIVIQGGAMDDIALEDRTLLSPAEFDSLDRTAQRIKHPVVETSPAYYTHWVNMAGLSDATRQQFLSHDFGKDRADGKLSESDFHYFAHLQLELRTRDERQADASDARQQRAQDQLRRREETSVLKAAQSAQKSAATRSVLDSSVTKYLPPIRPVTLPRWMVDSAKTDTDYADYLKLHGVDVDTLPAPNARPPLPTPKAPGAPISR